ncbi:MAG: Crp/Fnr family transcriptional regulator [Janthinobacterium lividum]
MMNDEALYHHFNKLVPLTTTEFAAITDVFTFRALDKKEVLLWPGEVCRHLTFVTQGVLRAFTIDEKGHEFILQFALEGWWIADVYSFLCHEPGTYAIEALEPAQVLQLDHAAWQGLLDTQPKYERYFRLLLQNNYVATHRRLALALSRTAEEKYDALLATMPTILQRVPQHLLASYLGITPEFLSRIRSRRVKGPLPG